MVGLNNPVDGERWYNALMKAMHEIERNRSIRFFNGILAFVSSFSNKTRYVTKNGCHASCDCKAEISYHSALFAILARYAELENHNSDAFEFCDFCAEPSEPTGIFHQACEDFGSVDLTEVDENNEMEREEYSFRVAA